MHFFVRMSTMYTAEGCLFSVYDFSVAPFIDFAATVGTDIEAWFNSNGNKFCEPLEKTSTKIFTLLCEFKNFSLLLTHWLDNVFYQPLPLKLLKERVN